MCWRMWLIDSGGVCHAYCLMDNHYHLMIETPQANLSRGMGQLNGIYTQRFNRKHGRVGHVYQGRFKSILVDKDSYLLELSCYVVLNPVRAEWMREAYCEHGYTMQAIAAFAGVHPSTVNRLILLSTPRLLPSSCVAAMLESSHINHMLRILRFSRRAREQNPKGAE